ncbi:MAG: peptide-methionine (S)-S-oxide reductase [Halobacteriovorax sp.]|nr:peptide-methionine (S)-S-oxide reductase [Halobacteriovorax sp.]|tara:strand:+ start:249660 stop:250151 length:492 start_codon:yes stop_codon:yes gene_type:complete
MEKVSFAAGCFWGVEHAFKQIPGVLNTTCGYQGGQTTDPTYEDICKKETGHAEVVLVEFDSKIISFERLLDAFFFMHNPTELNRQGPDVGTQYRSAIFPTTEEQRELSQKRIESMGPTVVTTIEEFDQFFDAETYHQKYLDKNPDGYCHIGLNVFKALKSGNY